MGAVTFDLEVIMDGAAGPELVTADQRDVARWEAQPFGCGFSLVMNKITVFYRYIAWAALKRERRMPHTWEQFNTVLCLHVGHLDDELPVAVDPTEADPSAGT